MNWKIFGLKYDNRETWAFEKMSYLLFCAEFDIRIGLFRYKNQTGIEAEPIETDGKYYGFRSKYYTTSIAVNKDDIIDSIKKAKSKKNPQHKLDIEKAAKTEGINIQWRAPSHLELQLSLPDNKYIDDIFLVLTKTKEICLMKFLNTKWKRSKPTFKLGYLGYVSWKRKLCSTVLTAINAHGIRKSSFGICSNFKIRNCSTYSSKNSY